MRKGNWFVFDIIKQPNKDIIKAYSNNDWVAMRKSVSPIDIIKSLNGKEINIARNLKSELYANEVGDIVEVGVERDGKMLSFDVELIKHPYGYTPRNILARK